jgi:predicted phage terminase large subunit-like protein
MAEFKLTPRQQEANELLASPATHIMLAGGSRSGKTLLIVRAIIIRALKAPGSRHAIFRFRFGHVKQSVMNDTLPKCMKLCFPQVKWEMNRSDAFMTLPGGSEIIFGGLDEKERVERVLGNEFATIFLNECSQIPYASRNMAVTRLAQKVTDTVTAEPLALKFYLDENPPSKGHWTYSLFKTKTDPDSKQMLRDPENYAFMKLNPYDNKENLNADYIKTLEALPVRLRKRFLEGEFAELAPNALFTDEAIEKWRLIDQELPQMLRIVVAVDPSGADDENNADNDDIGIIVAGLAIDGNAYVLEDLTCKAGPATWGRVATQAYDRHQADRIVAEINYGGAMVRNVIHTARPRTPFRAVTASRGKAVRAEPVSALMETGKVRMAGSFPALEEELYGFTTSGFMGEHSPNRADAMIWAISDLFPELLKKTEEKTPIIMPQLRRSGSTAWMHR